MAVPAPKIIVIITEDLNLQKISHTAFEKGEGGKLTALSLEKVIK